MRKVILGCLLIVLSGCVPALLNLLIQDTDKGALQLTTTSTGTIITFSAGQKDAQEVALYIGGENLQVADDKCQPVDNGMGCDLGNINTGASYEVIIQGSKLSANVTYYRPGSSQPLLLLLEVQ